MMGITKGKGGRENEFEELGKEMRTILKKGWNTKKHTKYACLAFKIDARK